MKKISTVLLLFGLSLSLMASQERKVLIIGIDGTRPDALLKANTPTIDSLVATSLYSYAAWHMGITISGPSWSDIMCGVWEQKHGVTGNDYSGSKFNDYPYFVKRAKEVLPDLYAVQVAEWSALYNYVYNDGFDEKIKTACDACMDETNNTAELACAELSNDNLDCMFLYFDQVDVTGHTTGFSKANNKYIQAIEYVDAKVNVALNCLRNRPNYVNEDWLILLITDHGGLGLGHGGGTKDERKIWWIASGDAVEHGENNAPDPGTYVSSYKLFNGVIAADPDKIKNALVQTDIAVTALHHLLADTIGDSIQPYIEQWSLDGKSWLKPNTATPVKDNQAKAFFINLYPNPAGNEITIWADFRKYSMLTWRIIDMSGKVMMSKEVSASYKVNINTVDLPAGVYAAEVELPNGEKAVRQFVKQ